MSPFCVYLNRLSFHPSPFHSLFLSLPLSFILSLFISFSLWLFHSLSLSFRLLLYSSLSLFPSYCISLSLFSPLTVYLSSLHNISFFCLYLSFTLSSSLSLSLFLTYYISLSLPIIFLSFSYLSFLLFLSHTIYECFRPVNNKTYDTQTFDKHYDELDIIKELLNLYRLLIKVLAFYRHPVCIKL